jgi:hypothetical protein
MFTRLRTGWLAGSGALLLVLSLSGAVLGATVLTGATGPQPLVTEEEPEAEVDTSLTFEDVDGNGVDDDCQDGEVVPDEEAAAAAEAAADLDGDGDISVSEAAQSGRVGGKNCNHGGYVSLVAHGQADECETEIEEPATGLADEGDGDEADEGDEGELVAFDEGDLEESEADAAEACEEEEEEEEEEETAEEVDATECEEVPAPEPPAEFTNVGAWVSAVAKSDAIGGKNCNHGGAVSEAAKAAQEARDAAREARKAEQQALREAKKAERDAAKAARAAERDAAKAARAAERAADKAERDAAKAARKGGHGKGHGKGH